MDVYLGVKFLGHVVALCLTFRGTAWQFFTQMQHISYLEWCLLKCFERKKEKKVKSLSSVWLFVTPWTVVHQAPLSMEFFRQKCWSGLPFPFPGDFPNPGTIFNWIVFLLLSCSSLCFLNVRPLSELWFANIFFHSVGCLFPVVIVSFDI